MSGPYKMCSKCDGPGVTCKHCYYDDPDEDEVDSEDQLPDVEMVATVRDSEGRDVTGFVRGKAL